MELVARAALDHADRTERAGALALLALARALTSPPEQARQAVDGCAALLDTLTETEAGRFPEYAALLGWAEALLGLGTRAARHLERAAAALACTGRTPLSPLVHQGLALSHLWSDVTSARTRTRAAARAVRDAGGAELPLLTALLETSTTFLAGTRRPPVAPAGRSGRPDDSDRPDGPRPTDRPASPDRRPALPNHPTPPDGPTLPHRPTVPERRAHPDRPTPADRSTLPSRPTPPDGPTPPDRPAVPDLLALALDARERGDAATAVSALLTAGGGPELRRIPPVLRPAVYETLAALSAPTATPSPAEWASLAERSCEGTELPLARAFAAMARAHALRGRPADAALLHQRASCLFASLGATWAQAWAMTHAAACVAADGRTPEALSLLEYVMELADSTGAARLHAGALALHAELLGGAEGPGPLSSLTVREREVADIAGVGKKTREIAQELSVSPRTVDAHLARIYRKLNVRSRAALARLMAETG
ncbi:LuxR C-terminal-related transcriptional regulator [Streptomyces sp. NPDC055103]